MKLHDLKPAPGSRTEKRRVGRGIAAGQGKTAGRGTKGQKARAGGSIPAWFEGGQTPLHQRIPKLRGFRNPFKIHYEIVNVGDIARLVELGELESGEMPGGKGQKKGTPAPITVNQEILRAAGLVRRVDRPMKVLGGGDLSTALFVVADAFSASARTKIEAAGGTVSVLEVPVARRAALGIEDAASAPGPEAESGASEAAAAESDQAAGSGTGAADATPASRGRASGAAVVEAADDDAGEADADAEATGTGAAAEPADAEPADAEPADAEADTTPAPAAKARPARKPRPAKPDTDA
jgi:large subunit ribosomal protein L15